MIRLSKEWMQQVESSFPESVFANDWNQPSSEYIREKKGRERKWPAGESKESELVRRGLLYEDSRHSRLLDRMGIYLTTWLDPKYVRMNLAWMLWREVCRVTCTRLVMYGFLA